MFMEFQFEDIIFGIFPKVGAEMLDAFGYWPNNSVGDIIDMLLQMLEVSFHFTYVVSQFHFFKLLFISHEFANVTVTRYFAAYIRSVISCSILHIML